MINRKIFITILALAIMTGCSSQEIIISTPTSMALFTVETAQATLPVVPTTSIENDDDECDNAFYPVSDEATWEYSLSSGDNAIHTMAVDDNDAFIITIQGGNSTFTIDGKCTDEGIVLMNTSGATTTYTGDEGSAVVTTMDVTGVTLPKDIKINDEWSQTIHVKTGDYSSTIQSDFTVLGFENITVPAGDFYVLRIEQSGYVEIFGQKVKMHGYQWFAEGVGTVKSAMDDSPSAELVSYDIPD